MVLDVDTLENSEAVLGEEVVVEVERYLVSSVLDSASPDCSILNDVTVSLV